MRRGFTLWLTGLSGSGKTTLAEKIEETLLERGVLVEVLDGERVRRAISPELGFGPADRSLNLQRMVYVAGLLNRNGVSAIVAAVSPLRKDRAEARQKLSPFVEAFVRCPLEVCKGREGSGLYRLAETGAAKDVAGVDVPYEPPEQPETEIFTDRETPDESAARIVQVLEILNLIPSTPASAYTPEEEAEIRRRLTDLGYI